MIWLIIALLLSAMGSVISMPAFSDQYNPVTGNKTLIDRQVGQKKWKLQIEYSGKTFFDGWDFFNTTVVNYVNASTAFASGLAFWTQDGTPGIQADHWSDLPVGSNRDSIRITTRQLFSGGVFIIDVRLMPWGCGVWPAFWTLGYNDTWPLAGEIDLIEGIQAMKQNQMTIHTKPGCVVDPAPGKFSGHVNNPICDRASGGTGCSIISSSPISFGEEFNIQGGGVYAMQWDGDGIKMWNWIRKDIPADITSGKPTPSGWGMPVAAWGATTCDPFEFFKPQTLILNINLCGDWAGQLYNQFQYCPGTCAEHIAKAANVNNAIWLINSLRVYQIQGDEAIEGQAPTNANLTGSPGPVNIVRVEGNRSRGNRGRQMPVGALGVVMAVLGVSVSFI